MKTLLKSLKITLAFCVFFSVFYILILWLFAQVAGPNKGNAEVVTLNGKVVGAANVGQMFTKDIYFWGRPSCAGDGYDATSSAGSNKGPTNQEYLDEVKARIDTFLVHHPYLSRKEVPAEMVTASGSGLDPNITPQCAYVQGKRVEQAQHTSFLCRGSSARRQTNTKYYPKNRYCFENPVFHYYLRICLLYTSPSPRD